MSEQKITDKDLREVLFEEKKKFLDENREEIIRRAQKTIRERFKKNGSTLS